MVSEASTSKVMSPVHRLYTALLNKSIAPQKYYHKSVNTAQQNSEVPDHTGTQATVKPNYEVVQYFAGCLSRYCR